MFDDARITAVFFGSLATLLISVMLAVFGPDTVGWTLVTVILGTISSTVFFPLSVGYFYDRFRERREGEGIWKVFREFSDGGILRIYKDREENEYTENAQIDLRAAFDNCRSGEVKMLGVSLRVFFQPVGPFYRNIVHITEFRQRGEQTRIKALVCHPDSPEVANRARIETAPRLFPGIISDIGVTVESIRTLNSKCGHDVIECRAFQFAPYCTMVIFEDKCYFSPNILSRDAPVRLPMIIFSARSHSYKVLNDYFEYVWSESAACPDVAEGTE